MAFGHEQYTKNELHSFFNLQSWNISISFSFHFLFGGKTAFSKYK